MDASFDPRWNEIHSEREWGDVPDNHLVRFIRRNYAKPIVAKTALDIGCGAGAQTKFLAREGFTVLGIDASEAAINRCWSENVPRAGYSVINATQIPFSRSYDLAVDVCSLQHIPAEHIAVALAGVHRALDSTGIFFSISARWDHSHAVADTPLRTMRRDQLESLYSAAGLKIFSLERTYRSDNGEQISHWIIAATKQ